MSENVIHIIRTRIQPPKFHEANGRAFILNTPTKNMPGTSRLKYSSDVLSKETITGISHVRNPLSLTPGFQDGPLQVFVGVVPDFKRFTVTHDSIQLGISRLRVSDKHTQTGVARFQISSVHTLAGFTSVRSTTKQEQDGIVRFQVSTNQEQSGMVRFQITTGHNQAGVATVHASTLTEDQVQTGTANLFSFMENADPLGVWARPNIYNSGDSIDITLYYPRPVVAFGAPSINLKVNGESVGGMYNTDGASNAPVTADTLHFSLMTDTLPAGLVTFDGQPIVASHVWNSDDFNNFVIGQTVARGASANNTVGFRARRRMTLSVPDPDQTLDVSFADGIIDVLLATDGSGTSTTLWSDIIFTIAFETPDISAVASFTSSGLIAIGTDDWLVVETGDTPIYLDGGSDSLSYWDYTYGDVFDTTGFQRFQPEGITVSSLTLLQTPDVVVTFDQPSYSVNQPIVVTLVCPFVMTIDQSPVLLINNGTTNLEFTYLAGDGTNTVQFTNAQGFPGSGQLAFGTVDDGILIDSPYRWKSGFPSPPGNVFTPALVSLVTTSDTFQYDDTMSVVS